MSYYGVSVIITILITSMVAFYLLYRARELNLGILISIAIGSIILGFTFYPAFKAVLRLLSESINVNKKLALVISLLMVLFIFLIFILIVSFIISFCIPKKLTSIDCCLVIDRIISIIKEYISTIKDKLIGSFRKIILNIKEIVKKGYNLINKLKKPVDTNQIIDTMGIEKNKIGILQEETTKNTNFDNLNTSAFANLIGFMEPSREIACANQDDLTDADIIDQTIEINDNTYNDLAALAYQEVIPVDNIVTFDENEVNDLSEIIVEVKLEDQVQVVENEVIETKVIETETLESEIPENEILEAEFNQILPSDANSFVLKAFESKTEGRKEEAIGHYIQALEQEPNNETIYWIVLDVCALYKQLGLSELAKSILEGLVNEYGSVIQPEIKMEIMNSLK